MNTIGQRIFYYRKKRGLTQKEFARRLAVCPQTVSKWENDRSLPDLTTVARIDDAGSYPRRKEIRGTCRGMAQNDQVDLQGFDVFYGIEEGFSFSQTAGIGGHVDDISREPLFGKFERGSCASAGLHEEIDHRFPSKGRDFLNFSLRNFLEFLADEYNIVEV